MCNYQSVSVSQSRCTWPLFAYSSLKGTQDYAVIHREMCSSAIITPSENRPKCHIISAFCCANAIFVRLFLCASFILHCCLWTSCEIIPLTVQINETYSRKLIPKKKNCRPFSSCGVACHFTLLQLYVRSHYVLSLPWYCTRCPLFLVLLSLCLSLSLSANKNSSCHQSGCYRGLLHSAGFNKNCVITVHGSTLPECFRPYG